MITLNSLTENQKIHVKIEGKIYEAIVKNVYADCCGIELPFGSDIGVVEKKENSELVRLTTVFAYQIERVF